MPSLSPALPAYFTQLVRHGYSSCLVLGLAADAVNMVILDWLIERVVVEMGRGQEGELGLLCWSWFLAGPATHSLCALPQAAASAPLLAFSPNFSEPL